MRLKELRLSKNLKQQEIANSLNINRMKYNHYELGNSEPNIGTLIKLADFYKITVDELIGHEVPYLISKSQFSDKQLQVVESAKTLSGEMCEKVLSYIDGLKNK